MLGGAGIVVGLATYGYKIMRVLGVKAVKVTNARGFCLELSTAITVVIASRYGAHRHPAPPTPCAREMQRARYGQAQGACGSGQRWPTRQGAWELYG